MQIIKASSGREYGVEKLPLLRAMSSGLKLTTKVMDNLGLEVGSKLSYGRDKETGKLYLYVTDGESGNIIGKNKAFTNAGLLAEMTNASGQPGLVVNGQTHLIFTVAESPVNFEGTDYYEIVFSRVDTDTKEEASTEVESNETATETETSTDTEAGDWD